MYDPLSVPSVENSVLSDETPPLMRAIVTDVLETKRKFAEQLSRYDGDKTTFPLIISDALNRQGLSLSELAAACHSTPTTISRWAKGATPSGVARRAVVELIRDALVQQVEEMRDKLPAAMRAR